MCYRKLFRRTRASRQELSNSGKSKLPIQVSRHGFAPTRDRREMLRKCGSGLTPVPLLLAFPGYVKGPSLAYAGSDERSDAQLLDEVQRAAFRFFWDEASPTTGQVKDRALAAGGGSERMSSIAATGFGLAGLCVGDSRGSAERSGCLRSSQ